MFYALKKENTLEIKYKRYVIHFKERDFNCQMEVTVIRMLLRERLLKLQS